MRPRLVPCLCLVVLTAACRSGGSDPDPGASAGSDAVFLSSLDLGDARALFVVRAPNGLSDRLLQVTADDRVVEVPQRLVDAAGRPAPGATPLQVTDVVDAGPEYLLVATLTFADPPGGIWLVRRSDGAAALVATAVALDRLQAGFLNAPPVQVDARGRLYLLVYPRGTVDFTRRELVRIDPADPARPVLELLVPLSEIGQFAVSAGGDVFYTVGPAGAREGLILLAGGQPIDAPTEHVWVASDGSFAASEGLQLERLAVSASGVTAQPYGDRLVEWGGATGYRLATRDTLYVLQGFRVTAVDGGAPFTPRAWRIVGYGGLVAAGASDAALYVAATRLYTGTTLARWTPDPAPDGTVTELLAPGTYDVGALAVARDGRILLGATRASDGKDVLAAIDAAGHLSILDDTLGVPVRDLVWR